LSARARRIFLRACSANAPADWDDALEELRAATPEEWQFVATLATWHAVMGLVARNLEWARTRAGIPIPIVAAIALQQRGALVQALNRKAAARRAAEALAQAAIPFIAFKGVVLAEECYGGLALRAFRDFDAMVQRAEVERAAAVLFGIGYRLPDFKGVRDWMDQGAHAIGLPHPDGNSVDLHWAIAPSAVDSASIEAVWRHTVPAPANAALPGLRLSPEMTLVHLAEHFHSHEYGNFKPLVDFLVAARAAGASLDADRLRAAALPLGATPMVAVATGVCTNLFPSVKLPAALLQQPRSVAAAAACRTLTGKFLLEYPARARISNWLRFLAASGSVQASLRSIAGLLVPSRMLLAQFFSRPYDPGMYPRYYWRQLVKVVTLSNK
jgi:hypothetical protein